MPACGVRAHRLHRRRPAGPRPSKPRCGCIAQALPASPTAARWPRMLLRMLHDVLHTPLPGGHAPGRRAAAARLVETGVPPARRGSWARRRWARCCGSRATPCRRWPSARCRAICAASSTWCSSTRVATTSSTGSPTTWASTPPTTRRHALARAMAAAGLSPAVPAVRAGAAPPPAAAAAGLRLRRGTSAACCYLFVRGVRPAWAAADGRARACSRTGRRWPRCNGCRPCWTVRGRRHDHEPWHSARGPGRSPGRGLCAARRSAGCARNRRTPPTVSPGAARRLGAEPGHRRRPRVPAAGRPARPAWRPKRPTWRTRRRCAAGCWPVAWSARPKRRPRCR